MKLPAPRFLAVLLLCLCGTLRLPNGPALAQEDTPPPLGAQTPPPPPEVKPPPTVAPPHGGKGKAPKDATPKPPKVRKAKEFSFPLPIGERGKNIKIPQLGQAGELLQQLMATNITRIDNEHVEMHEANIDLFHPDGKEDFHVLLPDSVLDLKTQIITSDHPVTVRTEDFELTGERMAFNTVDRTGELQGHVHMVIRNFKQVAGVVPATSAP